VTIDGKQLPGAGQAAQFDVAAVLEAGARADDQVTHSAGHEDVTGTGLAADPRRDVYRDPPKLLYSIVTANGSRTASSFTTASRLFFKTPASTSASCGAPVDAVTV
jgi:hypothetical protein